MTSLENPLGVPLPGPQEQGPYATEQRFEQFKRMLTWKALEFDQDFFARVMSEGRMDQFAQAQFQAAAEADSQYAAQVMEAGITFAGKRWRDPNTRRMFGDWMADLEAVGGENFAPVAAGLRQKIKLHGDVGQAVAGDYGRLQETYQGLPARRGAGTEVPGLVESLLAELSFDAVGKTGDRRSRAIADLVERIDSLVRYRYGGAWTEPMVPQTTSVPGGQPGPFGVQPLVVHQPAQPNRGQDPISRWLGRNQPDPDRMPIEGVDQETYRALLTQAVWDEMVQELDSDPQYDEGTIAGIGEEFANQVGRYATWAVPVGVGAGIAQRGARAATRRGALAAGAGRGTARAASRWAGRVAPMAPMFAAGLAMPDDAHEVREIEELTRQVSGDLTTDQATSLEPGALEGARDAATAAVRLRRASTMAAIMPIMALGGSPISQAVGGRVSRAIGGQVAGAAGARSRAILGRVTGGGVSGATFGASLPGLMELADYVGQTNQQLMARLGGEDSTLGQAMQLGMISDEYQLGALGQMAQAAIDGDMGKFADQAEEYGEQISPAMTAFGILNAVGATVGFATERFAIGDQQRRVLVDRVEAARADGHSQVDEMVQSLDPETRGGATDEQLAAALHQAVDDVADDVVRQVGRPAEETPRERMERERPDELDERELVEEAVEASDIAPETRRPRKLVPDKEPQEQREAKAREVWGEEADAIGREADEIAAAGRAAPEPGPAASEPSLAAPERPRTVDDFLERARADLATATRAASDAIEADVRGPEGDAVQARYQLAKETVKLGEQLAAQRAYKGDQAHLSPAARQRLRKQLNYVRRLRRWVDQRGGDPAFEPDREAGPISLREVTEASRRRETVAQDMVDDAARPPEADPYASLRSSSEPFDRTAAQEQIEGLSQEQLLAQMRALQHHDDRESLGLDAERSQEYFGLLGERYSREARSFEGVFRPPGYDPSRPETWLGDIDTPGFNTRDLALGEHLRSLTDDQLTAEIARLEAEESLSDAANEYLNDLHDEQFDRSEREDQEQHDAAWAEISADDTPATWTVTREIGKKGKTESFEVRAPRNATPSDVIDAAMAAGMRSTKNPRVTIGGPDWAWDYTTKRPVLLTSQEAEFLASARAAEAAAVPEAAQPATKEVKQRGKQKEVAATAKQAVADEAAHAKQRSSEGLINELLHEAEGLKAGAIRAISKIAADEVPAVMAGQRRDPSSVVNAKQLVTLADAGLVEPGEGGRMPLTERGRRIVELLEKIRSTPVEYAFLELPPQKPKRSPVRAPRPYGEAIEKVASDRVFKALVGKVAAQEETRYAINGVRYDAERGRLVATDGRKLVVIPVGQALGDKSKVFDSAGRELEDRFPDYNRLLSQPDSHGESRGVIDTWQLEGLGRYTALFEGFFTGDDLANMVVIDDPSGARVPIFLGAEHVRAVSHALAQAGVERVEIRVDDDANPVVIMEKADHKPLDQRAYALIMPIRGPRSPAAKPPDTQGTKLSFYADPEAHAEARMRMLAARDTEARPESPEPSHAAPEHFAAPEQPGSDARLAQIRSETEAWLRKMTKSQLAAWFKSEYGGVLTGSPKKAEMVKEIAEHVAYKRWSDERNQAEIDEVHRQVDEQIAAERKPPDEWDARRTELLGMKVAELKEIAAKIDVGYTNVRKADLARAIVEREREAAQADDPWVVTASYGDLQNEAKRLGVSAREAKQILREKVRKARAAEKSGSTKAKQVEKANAKPEHTTGRGIFADKQLTDEQLLEAQEVRGAIARGATARVIGMFSPEATGEEVAQSKDGEWANRDEAELLDVVQSVAESNPKWTWSRILPEAVFEWQFFGMDTDPLRDDAESDTGPNLGQRIDQASRDFDQVEKVGSRSALDAFRAEHPELFHGIVREALLYHEPGRALWERIEQLDRLTRPDAGYVDIGAILGAIGRAARDFIRSESQMQVLERTALQDPPTGYTQGPGIYDRTTGWLQRWAVRNGLANPLTFGGRIALDGIRVLAEAQGQYEQYVYSLLSKGGLLGDVERDSELSGAMFWLLGAEPDDTGAWRGDLQDQDGKPLGRARTNADGSVDFEFPADSKFAGQTVHVEPEMADAVRSLQEIQRGWRNSLAALHPGVRAARDEITWLEEALATYGTRRAALEADRDAVLARLTPDPRWAEYEGLRRLLNRQTPADHDPTDLARMDDLVDWIEATVGQVTQQTGRRHFRPRTYQALLGNLTRDERVYQSRVGSLRSYIDDVERTWGYHTFHHHALKVDADATIVADLFDQGPHGSTGAGREIHRQHRSINEQLGIKARAHTGITARRHRDDKGLRGRGLLSEDVLTAVHDYILSFPLYTKRAEFENAHSEFLYGKLTQAQEVTREFTDDAGNVQSYDTHEALVPHDEVVYFDKRAPSLGHVVAFYDGDDRLYYRRWADLSDRERDAWKRRKQAISSMRFRMGSKGLGHPELQDAEMEGVMLWLGDRDRLPTPEQLEDPGWVESNILAESTDRGPSRVPNLVVVDVRSAREHFRLWRNGWYQSVLEGSRLGREGHEDLAAQTVARFIEEQVVGGLRELHTGIRHRYQAGSKTVEGVNRIVRSADNIAASLASLASASAIGGPTNVRNAMQAALGGITFYYAAGGRFGIPQIPSGAALRATRLFGELERQMHGLEGNALRRAVARLTGRRRNIPEPVTIVREAGRQVDVDLMAEVDRVTMLPAPDVADRVIQAGGQPARDLATREAVAMAFRSNILGGNRGDQLARNGLNALWAFTAEPRKLRNRIIPRYGYRGIWNVWRGANDAFWAPFNWAERYARIMPWADAYIAARTAGASRSDARDRAFAAVHNTQMVYTRASKARLLNNPWMRMFGALTTWSVHAQQRIMAMGPAQYARLMGKLMAYGLLTQYLTPFDFTRVLTSSVTDLDLWDGEPSGMLTGLAAGVGVPTEDDPLGVQGKGPLANGDLANLPLPMFWSGLGPIYDTALASAEAMLAAAYGDTSKAEAALEKVHQTFNPITEGNWWRRVEAAWGAEDVDGALVYREDEKVKRDFTWIRQQLDELGVDMEPGAFLLWAYQQMPTSRETRGWVAAQIEEARRKRIEGIEREAGRLREGMAELIFDSRQAGSDEERQVIATEGNEMLRQLFDIKRGLGQPWEPGRERAAIREAAKRVQIDRQLPPNLRAIARQGSKAAQVRAFTRALLDPNVLVTESQARNILVNVLRIDSEQGLETVDQETRLRLMRALRTNWQQTWQPARAREN